jgi:imidazolonepropionase-like amidohydrolase
MRSMASFLLCLCLAAAGAAQAWGQSAGTTAYVGGTVIDGSGTTPIQRGVILVRDGRIISVGREGQVALPSGTTVIRTDGKYIIPGLIDTNSHISLYGGTPLPRYETTVRYWNNRDKVTLEGAQRTLKYGVTTLLDTYGSLPQLLRVRDSINAGAAVGPRIYAGGNIVGWGGPFSGTFSGTSSQGLTRFQQELNDEIIQGVGEDLASLNPDQLRARVAAYIKRGPTLVKYGGTSHTSDLLTFSPEASRALIAEAHAHHLVVHTHATSPEAMRIAIAAGVDIIQHPEVPSGGVYQEIPDDIVHSMVEQKVICSVQPNSATGKVWQAFMSKSAGVESGAGYPADVAFMRTNIKKLIDAGCIMTIGSDNFAGASGEFRKGGKESDAVGLEWRQLGDSTLRGIEGLVELGMTPMQAIQTATVNGALAAGSKQIGMIAPDRFADLVILDADPLVDIHNLRMIDRIVVGGIVVRPDDLPSEPIFAKK